MPTSEQSDDEAWERAVESPVWYGTGAFSQRLDGLMEEGDGQPGTYFLFYGGTSEEHQQALGTLTRYAAGSMHQFRLRSLLSEYQMQTQNSLRKAFDHAAEENALLYFDRVDSLFGHTHVDAPDDPAQTAAPTTIEYFFDRVAAYTGIVVLALQNESHVEWAMNKVHLVVRFE